MGQVLDGGEGAQAARHAVDDDEVEAAAGCGDLVCIGLEGFVGQAAAHHALRVVAPLRAALAREERRQPGLGLGRQRGVGADALQLHVRLQPRPQAFAPLHVVLDRTHTLHMGLPPQRAVAGAVLEDAVAGAHHALQEFDGAIGEPGQRRAVGAHRRLLFARTQPTRGFEEQPLQVFGRMDVDGVHAAQASAWRAGWG